MPQLRNVRVTVSTTTKLVSATTVFSHLLLTLTSATAAVDIAPAKLTGAPYVAEFTGVPEGDYIATAQAYDADGNTIGDSITGRYTLALPSGTGDDPGAQKTVDVPSSFQFEVFE